MTGLLRKWGLGVELDFQGERATVKMTRTARAVATLRQGYEALGTSASRVRDGLGKIGLALAPVGVGFGYLTHQASSLAATLEGQQLTMRVLLGSQEKAVQLMAQIRDYAAATPFEQGDLIDGSKRLLKLTGDNVDANMDLLKLVSQMAALNPDRSFGDAAEALIDAAAGTGFERIKEMSFFTGMGADDFKALGKPGGKAWADGIVASFRQQVQDKLKGGDLVAELGQTFSGRMSTLRDAFDNALLPIGEAINRRLGPLLPDLADKIASQVPLLVGAADRLIGIFERVAVRAEPYVDMLVGLWDRLGPSGQENLLLAAMGVGALVAALSPLAVLAAGIGLVVSGLVSLGTALAPLFSVAAIKVVAGLAAALGLVVAAAYVLFRVFRTEGEGPLGFLLRVGTAVRTHLVDGFALARTLVTAFADGFLATFGGVEGAISSIGPPIRSLWDRLSGLFTLMKGGAITSTATWSMLGQAIGLVARVLVDKAAAGIELVVSLFDILLTTFQPLIVSVWQFMDGLLGLVTGAYSAETAISKMLSGIAGVAMSLIVAVFSLLLGAIELLLRSVILAVAGIPGMDRVLRATGNLGADALAGARQSFSDQITESLGRVGRANLERETERSRQAPPQVTVTPGETTVQANVTTEVKVDGREIARAVGGAQVKAGQRQGTHLPSSQRGRVLRGNGTVTPLAPFETIPG